MCVSDIDPSQATDDDLMALRNFAKFRSIKARNRGDVEATKYWLSNMKRCEDEILRRENAG